MVASISNVSVLAIVALVAVVVYVRYRNRETLRLQRDAELAATMKAAAADDPVRLAAVNEYETRNYERLFYAANVGPRARSAAWSLLGLAVSIGVLLTVSSPSGGSVAESVIFWIVAVLGAVFGVALLVFTALAIQAAVSLPRISFAEAYEDDVETSSADD
jgi:hypothetical protein